jgi:hypothetical protein
MQADVGTTTTPSAAVTQLVREDKPGYPVIHSYHAYGVSICSTHAITALQSTKPGPALFSIHFETGPEPQWAKTACSAPAQVRWRSPGDNETDDSAVVLTEHGRGQCYGLLYSGYARFVFDETAHRLWGAVYPPLSPHELELYFLGPAMGFLLRHRRITCVHASAVELHDSAVLFSGDAGYGKSTTAAAMALHGAPVLSDDIVPLTNTNERYWANPGYPRLCLWPDAVAKLLNSQEALPRLSPAQGKCYLPLDGVRASFAAQRKPLGIIYLFGERSDASDAPRIEELSPRQALLELVQNTYMNWLIDREQRAHEFDELYKIVQQVPVRRIVAHADGAKLGLLCDRIFQDAERLLARC